MGRILQDGWIQNYLRYSENQESPRTFHLWTGLTILAAALKRHVWIDRGGVLSEGEKGYYKLYPNMYTILVALSGACRKGAASNLGIRLLEDIESVRVFRGRITTSALIDFMAEAKPEQHGTKIHTDNSIILFAPELIVTLNKESFAADIVTILTDLYEDTRGWKYKTKTGGEALIPNISPTFFGATTPESLVKCIPFDAFGLGFSGRILFVVEDATRKRIAWPKIGKDLIVIEEKLRADLQHIASLYGQMEISDDAYKYFDDWYMNLSIDTENPLMSPYLQRKHDHVLKVAMLLSVSTNDKLVLRAAHIKFAISLLEHLERNMPLAFQYAGTDLNTLVGEFLNILKYANGDKVSHREIVTKLRMRIKNTQELNDLVDVLISSGTVRRDVYQGITYYTLTDESIKKFEKKEMDI